MKNLTPMARMQRHFSEKTYKHGYNVAKRAYRLGGTVALANIIIIISRSKMYDGKHGYNDNGIKRMLAGIESFIKTIV